MRKGITLFPKENHDMCPSQKSARFSHKYSESGLHTLISAGEFGLRSTAGGFAGELSHTFLIQ